jgi:dihydropteroate synthase
MEAAASTGWKIRNGYLDTGKKTLIMGILNLTPDSFYDGGSYRDWSAAVEHAQRMVAEGADILDVGGESSRPGSQPVSEEEELQRVIPVIRALAKKIKIPLSIDTYKSTVAEQALGEGAAIINDISALGADGDMAKVAVRFQAGIVLMHMQGEPRTMQKNPSYREVVREIADFFRERLRSLEEQGVEALQVVLDPGIGFGKTLEHNLELIRRLDEFKALERPLLVGISRKSFLGQILDLPPAERLEGSLAAGVAAVLKGAGILRVHDVEATVRACRVVERLKS